MTGVQESIRIRLVRISWSSISRRMLKVRATRAVHLMKTSKIHTKNTLGIVVLLKSGTSTAILVNSFVSFKVVEDEEKGRAEVELRRRCVFSRS